MITRVYGKANGAEVIFSHVNDETWEISVPWEDDGKYTAEIYAENEAGNTSHSLHYAIRDFWARTTGLHRTG